MLREIEAWLARFGLDEAIHLHALDVLTSLPEHVREDLMDDPCFTMLDYEPGPGMFHVPVGVPSLARPSRSVVFKRTLRRRPAGFVRYVIAHELAHAHLRNGGRSTDEDPEYAADAMAAEWGFPRVSWV